MDQIEEFAQQVVTGASIGSIYAIVALAIVMIYRSTGIVNFAQGEMATFTTFIAWSLMLNMDFWPAFFLAILMRRAGDGHHAPSGARLAAQLHRCHPWPAGHLQQPQPLALGAPAEAVPATGRLHR
jgi:hypothetical protein